MKFKIHENDINEYNEWLVDHIKSCTLNRSTAIGGSLTYSFTPTGLGTITKIKCSCGKELNLTHEEDW